MGNGIAHVFAMNGFNVHLVDISETPIVEMTETGIRTEADRYDFDVVIFATGFDAITGALDKLDIRGVEGQSLQEKFKDGPSTLNGVFSHGFPNLMMVAGPQSVSGSTNYPRAIETGVDWVTDFLASIRDKSCTRFEATEEAELAWQEEVRSAQESTPLSHSKSWFTGYNSNVEGREEGKIRYHAYWGGAPRYRSFLEKSAQNNYPGIERD